MPCDDRSMASSDLRGWRFACVGFDRSDVKVGGRQPVELQVAIHRRLDRGSHRPTRDKTHVLGIWMIDPEHGPAGFPAGELSKGVRCLYEPIAEA